jgi:hypothetical protein
MSPHAWVAYPRDDIALALGVWAQHLLIAVAIRPRRWGDGQRPTGKHDRTREIATNFLGMEASMSRKMMMAILPLVGLGLVLSAGTAEAGYSGPPSAYSDAYAYPYDDPLYGAFDFEYGGGFQDWDHRHFDHGFDHDHFDHGLAHGGFAHDGDHGFAGHGGFGGHGGGHR